MSSQLPDVLPALKAWLVDLNTGLGNRVAFKLPDNPKTVPFARLTRTGGAPLPDSDLPVSTLQASLEIWGMANSDYDAVRKAALQVEQAVKDVNGPCWLGPGVIALAMNVLTGYDSPDPDTGFPRYIMVIYVLARNA